MNPWRRTRASVGPKGGPERPVSGGPAAIQQANPARRAVRSGKTSVKTGLRGLQQLNRRPVSVDIAAVSDYDLICIGCGPAGEKAATQAAYFGHRVAIVERESSPGGAMVNTGTIASKSLRETALLCSAFRRRPLPGSEFTVDHRLSVATLTTTDEVVSVWAA